MYSAYFTASLCFNLDSRDGFGRLEGRAMDFWFLFKSWVDLFLVRSNPLLFLLQIGTKLGEGLWRRVVWREGRGWWYISATKKLYTYPNGVLTFPMTSLILGVMILPFWCLAVGGHCPSHSASSSTPCRKREGERRKDATGLATILTQ